MASKYFSFAKKTSTVIARSIIEVNSDMHKTYCVLNYIRHTISNLSRIFLTSTIYNTQPMNDLCDEYICEVSSF